MKTDILHIVIFIAFVALGLVFVTIVKRRQQKLLLRISNLLNELISNHAFDKSLNDSNVPKELLESIEKVNNYITRTESDIKHIILDKEFSINTESGRLSKVVNELYNSIEDKKQKEIQRKQEEEQINWATKGEAVFGEIIRSSAVDVNELAFNLLKNLIDYIGAIQGGLFVLNSDDKNEETYELKAAIAYDRRKILEKTINIGEGLVGRCAFEKLSIYMEDVPKDYVNITSGLGQSNPRSILLVPAMVDDKVYAVLELISFDKFLPFQINFVEKIGENIGSTLRNAMINENTKKLLEQSKAQSEEMAAQEEELRQNFEELQATQEEVHRLREAEAEKNQQMLDEVERYKTTLTRILDQIPDKIFLKDDDCRMLIVNKAVLDAHNATPEDLLGKNDFDFIEDKAEAQTYYDEEQQIIASGKAMKVHQKEIINNTGVHLDSIKIPFYIDYLGKTGILGIQHDITQLVNLEDKVEELQQELDKLNK